jgi:hypothetical protein
MGIAIYNADYQYRVLKSGRLAMAYTRLVIEILKVGGGGGKGWMKNGVVISNADYQYRVLKFGRLAIPYNRLVIEILRVEEGEGRGWMKDVVVHI